MVGGAEPEMDGGIFFFLMAGTCWYISAQQRRPRTQLCNGLQYGTESSKVVRLVIHANPVFVCFQYSKVQEISLKI